MATMKAVRIHSYGGPEVLVHEDAPKPMLARDEVLIKVHAAGVNPVDWKIREGLLQDVLHHQLPLVLGWDVSGTVESVGDAVGTLQPGDQVYSRPEIARDGAYAEYVAVRADEVAIKPDSLDHIHAAGVPLAALTAWQSLFDTAALGPGQALLIHAAAGGVGSFAVQLAKARGAYVIGTGSEKNRQFLRELGADEVIDYRTTSFEDALRNLDVVFDTVGGDTQERSWGVLRKGGMLVSIVAPPSPEQATQHEVSGAFVFVQPNASQLTEIACLIDAGAVKSIVETVLPLTEFRRAQALSQGGHTRGKIVLKVAA